MRNTAMPTVLLTVAWAAVHGYMITQWFMFTISLPTCHHCHIKSVKQALYGNQLYRASCEGLT